MLHFNTLTLATIHSESRKFNLGSHGIMEPSWFHMMDIVSIKNNCASNHLNHMIPVIHIHYLNSV